MLEAERDSQGRAITAALDRATLRERLGQLARDAGKSELRRML
jgi:hypothetical protein